MRVLITGATGFIGSALCQEMLDNGHYVTAVVNPESKRKDKIPDGVSLIELSLHDINKLSGSYDICYHLAWNGASGDSRNDFSIQLSNIKYTADLVKKAKELGCSKFIGAGSQAEYGVVRELCDEYHSTNPFMMYGAAKLASYHMGKVVAEQQKISFVWPRIYSVYGVGENSGTLLSYLIDCLKEDKPAELSACENMWDFIYITDCVKALRLLGENADSNGIYNISSGNPKILKSFVNSVKEIVNPDGIVIFGAKSTEHERTFWLDPDVSKIKTVGFVSEVEFEEGIRRRIDEK